MYRNPECGGLYYGILLRVNAPAKLVALSGRDIFCLTQAPYFGAVSHSFRCAVISRCKNALVFYDDRADLSSHACRALPHHAGDSHEVLIPARPLGVLLALEFLCFPHAFLHFRKIIAIESGSTTRSFSSISCRKSGCTLPPHFGIRSLCRRFENGYSSSDLASVYAPETRG